MIDRLLQSASNFALATRFGLVGITGDGENVKQLVGGFLAVLRFLVDS